MTRWAAVGGSEAPLPPTSNNAQLVHMSTAVHRPRNRTAWRALARQVRKNDGLFVHRREAVRNLPSPRASSGIDALGGAFQAAKRDLDTSITPFVIFRAPCRVRRS